MTGNAEELHHETGVFDAHGDLLYTVVREHDVGTEGVITEEFLPGMRAGGVNMRVVPIYLDADQAREPATRRGLVIAESFHREVEATDALTAVTTAAGVRDGIDSASVTLILGMEGAEPLAGELSVLHAFYRLGLRVLGLTHSRRNTVGDGAFFEPTRSGTPGGLSAFGVEAIDRCNDLGIVVDVSHLNEPGFWDVIEYTDDPIIASHSNCRALCDHPRNLYDEQLEAVAESGGVVGINALQAFLHGENPDVDTVVEQIAHAVEVAGIDHVGLGFDFYDYNLPYMSPVEREYMIDVSTAAGLGEDAEVANLTPVLLEAGFAPAEVKQLLKLNFARVFETVLE